MTELPPDGLTEEEAAAVWANLNDLEWFAENAPLTIQNKMSGEMTPFVMNSAQRYLHRTIERLKKTPGPTRVAVVKARQMGITTYMLARWAHQLSTLNNVPIELLIHDLDSAREQYNRIETMMEGIDPDLAPKRVAHETGRYMRFANKSQFTVTSVNKSGAVRSKTPRRLQATEMPSWNNPKKVFTGLIPAIPQAEDVEVIYETTAEGVGDWWHKFVQAVQAGDVEAMGRFMFTLVFLPWFLMDEYARTAERNELKREPLSDDEIALMQLMRESLPAYGVHDPQDDFLIEKILWRRDMLASPEMDYETFQQEYPATVEEAFISSGSPYFNRQSVQWHLNRLADDGTRVVRDPLQRFDVKVGEPGENGKRSTRWVEDDKGPLRVWEYPVEGANYIMAPDPASGDGADRSAAPIWRIEGAEMRLVACWHGHIASELFAYVSAFLGHKYNKALMAPERTGIRNVVEKLDHEIRYPKLYRFMSRDMKTNTESQKAGFETSSATRPAILEALYNMLTTPHIVIPYAEMVKEIQQFAYPDDSRRGKPQAPNGSFDDLVMSAAISAYIRGDAAPQRVGVVKRKNGPKYTTAA